MNYTENYHLPQWEESDRVMRTDFNQMCADIEAGLEQNAQAAAQAQSTAKEKTFSLGTYRGNGIFQSVEVGFHPSFVMIEMTSNSSSKESVCSFHFQNASYNVSLSDTGFTLSMDNGDDFPTVNRNGTWYRYIAFR